MAFLEMGGLLPKPLRLQQELPARKRPVSKNMIDRSRRTKPRIVFWPPRACTHWQWHTHTYTNKNTQVRRRGPQACAQQTGQADEGQMMLRCSLHLRRNCKARAKGTQADRKCLFLIPCDL